MRITNISHLYEKEIFSGVVLSQSGTRKKKSLTVEEKQTTLSIVRWD